MPDMPELVSKGSILKRLDASSHDPAWLQRVLDDLTASVDVADVAEQHGLVNQAEKQHLITDWFTNWWPDAQPVEPIVAQGFKVAIGEALKRELPLDCYWLCEPGHDDNHQHPPSGGEGTVEVAVCWSDQQVTVMINTPGPGDLSIPPVPATVDEPILVVKRIGGPNGSIVIRQPKHRP
jgi:hypothetical protein